MIKAIVPRWPIRPAISSEVLQESELRGVDSIRGILASSTNGFTGTGRNTPINLGNIVAKRGELEDWVKWKAESDAFWIRIGVVAAALAAVFSFVTLIK